MENISLPPILATEIGCEDIRREDIEHFYASTHDAQFIKYTTNKNQKHHEYKKSPQLQKTQKTTKANGLKKVHVHIKLQMLCGVTVNCPNQ